MTKFPQIFVLLIYRKNFEGTKKRVRNSHGKRAIVVRAIEVLLYMLIIECISYHFNSLHNDDPRIYFHLKTSPSAGTKETICMKCQITFCSKKKILKRQSVVFKSQLPVILA